MKLQAVECPVCGAPLDFSSVGPSKLTGDGHLTIDLVLSEEAIDHLQAHKADQGRRESLRRRFPQAGWVE